MVPAMRMVGVFVSAAIATMLLLQCGGQGFAQSPSPNTVISWGENPSLTPVPIAAQRGPTASVAGYTHSAVLRSDGSVFAWGNSSYGQATVPVALTDVAAIAAGDYHTVALKTDGTVVAWGFDIYGQSTVPLAAQSGVIAVAAGYAHTVVLKNSGSVFAWGFNDHGQCSVPLAAQNGVVAIAAGNLHTIALKNDGSVVAWGNNANGQTTVPLAAQSGIIAIAAGGYHNIGIKSDGSLVAWGYNSDGQTTIPAGLSGVTAVAAGGYHTVALRNDGSVVSWGANNYGQSTVPVTARSGVVAVAAGEYHTLALSQAPATVLGPTNQNVILGNVASFSPTVNGFSPLSYQWFGLTPLLSGATGTALVAGGFVFDAQLVSGGAGYVQVPAVRFVGGGGSGATATATVSNGAVVAITVVSPGSGYSSPPSLQIDPPNGFLTGQTNPVLTLNSVSTNDAGTYFVVITNAYGSVTSNPATLAVNVPVTLTQQPQSIVTALGSNAVFSVSASGTVPLSYQWYWQPGFSRTALAASDVRNGFVVGAAVLHGGGYYSSVPAVQILGGGSGASATATVNNGVVTAVNILAAGSGYPINAAIQIDPPVTGTTQLLSGQTATNLSLPGLGALASGSYFVVVTNASGSVTSSPALLRVLVPQRFVQPPQRLGDGTLRLLFGAHDGGFLLTNDLASLEVWGSTNLANTNAWLRITNGITVQNGQVQVDDADSPGLLRRFYRVLTR